MHDSERTPKVAIPATRKLRAEIEELKGLLDQKNRQLRMAEMAEARLLDEVEDLRRQLAKVNAERDELRAEIKRHSAADPVATSEMVMHIVSTDDDAQVLDDDDWDEDDDYEDEEDWQEDEEDREEPVRYTALTREEQILRAIFGT